MNEKDQRLLDFCRAADVDGVWLRRRANIAWITDGADVHCDTATQLGVASVVWTPQRKIVLTDNIEAARLREEEFDRSWEIRATNWWEVGETPDTPAVRDAALAEGGPSRASSAAEARGRTGRFASDWPEDVVAPLRFSLTPREIDRVRSLGRDTAEVVERIMKHDVKPGMTEWHLGGAVSGWLRDRGIHGHVILVAADERVAKYRHPIPTRKPIEKLAMVAVCAQRHGLIVSVTRLVHFGRLSDDLRRRHDAVTRVDNALHAATRVGTRWCDALQAGIDIYRETGFADEWKKHHQGGPMGYECRDFKATPTETRTVLPNQLVGWNPSITGTKSEDTILVNGTGNRQQATGPVFEVVTATSEWPLLNGRPEILVR